MKYKRLAEMAEDPESLTIFEQLVHDEMNHEKLLRSRYAAFQRMEQRDIMDRFVWGFALGLTITVLVAGVVLYRVLRQFRQMKIELKIE